MKHWFSRLSTTKQYGVVLGAGFFILILVAVAAGGGSTTTKTVTDTAASQAALRQARSQIKQEQDAAAQQVADAKDEVDTAKDDLASAKSDLSDERAKVRSERRKLERLKGQVNGVRTEIAKNSFDGEGMYVVGEDVSPGTYRASGTGDNCYWARLSSLSTDDIIDNNNTTGPVVLQVQPSDKAIQVSGCGEFHKAG